jgi:hypothetical protein
MLANMASIFNFVGEIQKVKVKIAINKSQKKKTL